MISQRSRRALEAEIDQNRETMYKIEKPFHIPHAVLLFKPKNHTFDMHKTNIWSVTPNLSYPSVHRHWDLVRGIPGHTTVQWTQRNTTQQKQYFLLYILITIIVMNIESQEIFGSCWLRWTRSIYIEEPEQHIWLVVAFQKLILKWICVRSLIHFRSHSLHDIFWTCQANTTVWQRLCGLFSIWR